MAQQSIWLWLAHLGGALVVDVTGPGAVPGILSWSHFIKSCFHGLLYLDLFLNMLQPVNPNERDCNGATV